MSQGLSPARAMTGSARLLPSDTPRNGAITWQGCFVLTGASYWTLADGTRHATGYWAEEFAAPYGELTGSGHEVVVATPGGVVPHVDSMSLRPAMAGNA